MKFNDYDLEVLLKNEVDIEFEGDFLLSGKQIAEVLDYSNSRKSLKDHVPKEDSYLLKNSNVTQSDFRKIANRGEIFINESGLYGLIFGSTKEEAKIFKRWVTSELLPAVRKNGGYIGSTRKFVEYHFQEMNIEDKTMIYQLFKTKDNQRKLIEEHEKIIKKQKNILIEQQPKIERFDRFLNFETNTKISIFAKFLNLGPNKLFIFLREQKILMSRKGNSYWNVPYQKHINAKHFIVKPSTVTKGKKEFETYTSLITKKGMNYVYKKINDANAWKKLKS
jgi:anti-repressor protein